MFKTNILLIFYTVKYYDESTENKQNVKFLRAFKMCNIISDV